MPSKLPLPSPRWEYSYRTLTPRRNFTSPWDHPTTFAQPNIGLPLLERTETQIKLFKEGLINATVIGVTI